MIAYKMSFLKQDRSVRDIFYARLSDLTETYPNFFDKFTSGTGTPKTLKPGSEMVFDLENVGFRIVNHLTALSEPEKVEVPYELVHDLLDEAA